MGKHYSERQRNLPPSQRTYKRHLNVPSGCVDVWRINVVDTVGNVTIHTQHREREICMQVADGLHNTRVMRTGRMDGRALRYVYVEHKAAVQIGDKFHIINIPSFRFADSVQEAPRGPDPDHKQWLAEFEGRPRASDPGEGIHNEINYKESDE